MKTKKQLSYIPGLRGCFWRFWLFVALWLVEQQNVYSSGASKKKAAEEDTEFETAGGLAGDTMAKLHAELAAQQEITDTRLATGLLTKNRGHVVALIVLFLILIRTIVLRRGRERKKKVEEEVRPPREEPQAKEQEGEEEAEEEEEKPVPEVEPSPEQVVLQPEEPAKEVPLPQVPTQVPVPRPRRKPKAEVPPEKQPEETGADGQPEEFVQQPVTRARKTRREVVRKEMPPPEAPTQVQPGIEEQVEEEEPVQQPTQPQPDEPTPIQPTLPQPPEQPVPGPAPGVPEVSYMEPTVPPTVVTVPPDEVREPAPVTVIHEDQELPELRARRSLVSSLVDVATRLVDELPGEQARPILDALKIKAAAAEKAEREYDLARSRRDPNLPGIRNAVIHAINTSIEGSRSDLLQLADLARSSAWMLSQVATLSSVENTAVTVKQENDTQLRILRSAQFIDECEADDFVDIYAAVAALNFRMKTLQRLAELDAALNRDILDMQKMWMKGRLQLDRIPLEVDANLVQELNVLFSKSRQAPPGQAASGITDADMEIIRGMFIRQYEDVQAMEKATSFDTVAAMYERAKMFNGKLEGILDAQKNKLRAALERQPLTKEEATVAAEAMAKIADTAVDEGEECWRHLQIVNSEVSGKYEEGPGGFGGKALLQKLTTKKKAGTAEQAESVFCPDSAIASDVKKHFTEQWRDLEAFAKEQWMKVQDMLEKAKKGAKYKLDKEGFGSTALDKKTSLRVETARKKAEAGIPSMLMRYYNRLVKEFEAYEHVVNAALIYPFRRGSQEWSALGELKSRFDSEKALAKGSRDFEPIPEYAATMLQTYLKIWSLVESERVLQLKEAMETARVDLHDAAQG
ncbi:uncharacterized protein EMH_0100230 [Eimeria mitis]|uniref:Uncharacterized protein n=1 Tax=Eimeria mitis TaxID=44415 RepID=U6JRX1_9EIME|nr:uncharacterized protein EMH_0100230 [Eimeria mitis]CDJ28184.1 hypothetical protein, conserved [Eimeria mitis]